MLLTFVYEEVLDWSDPARRDRAACARAHVAAFRSLLERGVACDRIDERLLGYDLERLAAAIDPTADLDLELLGVQTLYDRYLLVDKSGASAERIETPQLFWLRVAMGVCLGETGDREARVLDLYEVYRSRRFCSSTPTLFNAGTRHPQLSSCYLYVVDDSLESIMQRGIAENAMCSKWAGGLGGSWTAVRGTGSHIGGTNGESQGVLPFLKLHNDQLVAVNQGGKRAGSGCAYLEIWHNDIRDFLELRRGTGDERRRTHDMNTACWIPDLFMQRVEAREHWTLFRSSEVVGLHDLYGAAFAQRYTRARAARGGGRALERADRGARAVEADAAHALRDGAPLDHVQGSVQRAQPAGSRGRRPLLEPVHRDHAEHERGRDRRLQPRLDRARPAPHRRGRDRSRAAAPTVRTAVRALDNVIDINFYPTEAARRSNLRHRPVGLGVMGLQYALYRRGTEFGSEAAVEFSDEMMEAIAHYAYEASSDLAAERGAYASYAGSKWDRGLLPQDTLELLEQERGQAIDVPRGGRLDWGPLRARIARQGMRNSNVLAIAPTATIANIVGTSPCIEPTYKNVFAKSNLSGDFIVLNPFLVRDLKAAGLWTPELADQLKYFDGDLEQMPQVPQAAARPLPHRVPDRAPLPDRRCGPPAEVDRPVAVAEPVPAEPGHEGDEPHVPARVARRPQDDLLPAHARGILDREVDRVRRLGRDGGSRDRMLDRGTAERRGVRGLPVTARRGEPRWRRMGYSARASSRAVCRSSGSFEVSSMRSPVIGWSKARRAACRNWRLRPSSVPPLP